MSIPPSGPTCCCCGDPAVVNWVRRLTTDELSTLVAREQQKRDQLLAAALPTEQPVFGPMPTAADSTRLVHACAAHAIVMDLAALVHQNTCTAPNPANLPGCDCTPEQPSPPTEPTEAERPLPVHWHQATA